MTPKRGCELAMMLAVAMLKFLKLLTNSVCPIAVVKIPKKRRCSKEAIVLEALLSSKKGAKHMVTNRN
jgi:hypothetical protein